MFRLTQVPSLSEFGFRLRGFHPLWPAFPDCLAIFAPSICRRSYNPGRCLATLPVWALARSLATTCAIIGLFSFPPGTEMFQFPGLAPHKGVAAFLPSGCPIRKSMDQRIFAPTHGLSQLITSFVASESQGILHVPLSPFFIMNGFNRCFRRTSLLMGGSAETRLILFDLLVYCCVCFNSMLSARFARAFNMVVEVCFQNVNVLSLCVVPGRVELPTSTLSV